MSLWMGLWVGGYMCMWGAFLCCNASLCLSLQPFLGSSDSVNQISGKIKLGKEVLATLEGHWVSVFVIHLLSVCVCGF